MKKALLYLTLFGVIILPLTASAIVPPNSSSGGVTGVTPSQTYSFSNLFDRVINWSVGLLIILSVLFMIYAAYLYLFGGADESNLAKAKNIILYAVVAIVVAAAAYGIVGLARYFAEAGGAFTTR